MGKKATDLAQGATLWTNGDLSAVSITVPIEAFDELDELEIELPRGLLFDLVADYVRDRQIASLEQADTETILGLPKDN